MTVRLEVRDRVALITIHRPDVRNAFDLKSARTLTSLVDQIDASGDIRAAVITGSGGVFSAGMDLKAHRETGEVPVVERRGAFGFVEAPPRVPVVAAVEGWALGGGFELALACDMIVAGVGARFGLPEVARGRIASGGGVLRLPSRVPHNVAMELLLTGLPISAERGRELGLVNRVVPDGEAVAAALELAGVIAANAPLAVRTTKALAIAVAGWAPDEAFARQAADADRVSSSVDAAEGTRAFLERRPPRWTGA